MVYTTGLDVLKFSLALCPRVSSFLLALGEEGPGGGGGRASRSFVCLFCTC